MLTTESVRQANNNDLKGLHAWKYNSMHLETHVYENTVLVNGINYHVVCQFLTSSELDMDVPGFVTHFK